MRFGEFLIEQKIINREDLQDALAIQVDNPQLKLGEVLVAHGWVGNQQLLDCIQKYMEITGSKVDDVNEWLNQSEVDALLKKIRKE